MALKTVAIISPGDMGHAVGRMLGLHGFEVITCLANRSERTKRLAAEGGIRDYPIMSEMLERADIVLSIVPPGLAAQAAAEVAESMSASGFCPPYADCNAVSPETAKAIAKRISEAGADFIDGGILGPPPSEARNNTRFYFSGERAELLAELDGKGIVVRLLGSGIGRASGIKMCYAALTKGTHALQTAVITLAESLGLAEEVSHEFRTSQEASYKQITSSAPRLPIVAWRYIDEMKQIAQTFEAAGVTPKFHEGAAAVYY
ncbi:MAG: NAD(P)-dependent oxidoreductase [Nitrospinae bacterium]|nr:NAD(P)-dependent oxidoreductase [Nitrospinota bacterium]